MSRREPERGGMARAGGRDQARRLRADGLAGVGTGLAGGARRRRPLGVAISRVGLALALAFGGLAAGAGYWQVLQAPELSSSPDNPVVIAAARSAVRGLIRDRHGTILAASREDENGEPYRSYRDNAFAPVIGYASRQFGTAGLERAYDAELVGLRRPDPVADLLKKFSNDPYDPQSLNLTLSRPLQRAAVAALGDQRGAIVVVDPRTGEVLVLASTPIYDANAVANPATSEQAFNELREDDRQPLLPRATQGRYVPGSVFKIVTAIAGLESGAITPDTTYEQQPEAEETGLVVSGFRVRDGHHRATGNEALDLVGATEVSCNIWYALTGLATGPEALVDIAGRIGFGDRIPFDVPTAVSQLTNGGGPLPGGFVDDVELANAAYGQGETFVTPLQMALVASAVANDGILMEPHLVSSLQGEEATRRIEPQEWRRVASASNARAIQLAMQAAVEGELGRQFTTGADVPGVETAGKSGTAELGGAGEPHSWFIGFAPVDDPQVAIAVVVEQGGRGAEVASPIAGRMMEAALAELAGG
jgi:peptidoglycan glycosyltransferase